MSVNEPTDDWCLDEPAVSTPLLTGSGHESPAECSLAANSKGPKEDPLSIERTDDDAVVVQAQKTTGTSHPKSIRSKSHKKSVHYAPGPALSDPPNPTVPFADVPGLKGSSEISGNTGPTHRRHHPPKGSSEGCFYGSFHEAPTFMQENPFVHTGYRLQHTYTDCLLSWFGLHNETGNIWTHLLGSAVIVVLVAVWGPNLFTSSPLITPIHQLVWGVFIIGSIGCLACSTVYHTFTCHSAHTSQTCRSVDYLGVNLLILGSAYPMFYYMFACHPIARIVYPTLISVLGIPGLIGPFLPGFFDLRWEHPRTALYACLAISGFVPLIHAHVILPYRAANVLNFVLVYAMYLSYGIGLFFYATKIPERFSPGTFDLFFQSHNLWHIFVVGGAVIHMVNCYRLHQQWVAGTALGFQC